MPRVLITGINRGFGKAIAQEFLECGFEVIGIVRDRSLVPSYSDIQYHTVDLAKGDELEAFVSHMLMQGTSIDVIINNAARFDDEIDSEDIVDIERIHRINAHSPYLLSQKLLPLVKNSSLKTIIAISGRMGSISLQKGNKHPVYASSKAALNMYFKSLSFDNRDITVLIYHPGQIKTDMCGKDAKLTPEQAAKAFMKYFERSKKVKSLSGVFSSHDGNKLPW